MKFSDFSKVYNDLYPKHEPVASKKVTTATRVKDITKEVEEEVVDNNFIEVVDNEGVDDGSSGTSELDNE